MKHILDLCISRFNAFSRLQDELDRAKSALEERKLIDRAKGILMKLKGLSEEEAYALLRKTAMNEKRKIADVAPVGDHRRGAAEMTARDAKLSIGFIPLADAAALIVAADKGLCGSREGSTSSWCARCPGRTCATSSTSACSTPPI